MSNYETGLAPSSHGTREHVPSLSIQTNLHPMHVGQSRPYRGSDPRSYSMSTSASTSTAASSALFHKFCHVEGSSNTDTAQMISSVPHSDRNNSMGYSHSINNRSSAEEEADHDAADTLAGMRSVNSPTGLTALSGYVYTTIETANLASHTRGHAPIITHVNNDSGRIILPPPTPTPGYGPLNNDQFYVSTMQHRQRPSRDDDWGYSRYGTTTNPSAESSSSATRSMQSPSRTSIHGPVRNHVSSNHLSTSYRYDPYPRPMRNDSVSPRTRARDLMPPPRVQRSNAEAHASAIGNGVSYSTSAATTAIDTAATTSRSRERFFAIPSSSEPPNGWTCYAAVDDEPCKNDNPRKCLSHFFGRNKSETKRVPESAWIWLCRKHYQRNRYSANKGGVYWKIQIKMLRDQMDKMESIMGDITWRIQWTSSLDKLVREPVHCHATPSADVVAAQQLNSHCGDEKSTKEVRRFINDMERLCQAGVIQNELLSVEFLPSRWSRQQRN